MAECHPVGFQWVMEAKARGAKVIHVDPRFTRTSAVADMHVPIRAGSDIAFLGGLVNYTSSRTDEFREYVLAYTNAAGDPQRRLPRHRGPRRLVLRLGPEAERYDIATWPYDGGGARAAGAAARPAELGTRARATLSHSCVFQVLRRHFARYTPEMVEQVCGVPRRSSSRSPRRLCENSGRERTSAFCYAVGWTQHTVGVQYIRAAAIIQLLLGNIGRPGGGILALRGHASIQGSTDIPTLYDILPGYIPMPHAQEHQTLSEYVEQNSSATGYWGHMDAYVVSC